MWDGSTGIAVATGCVLDEGNHSDGALPRVALPKDGGAGAPNEAGGPEDPTQEAGSMLLAAAVGGSRMESEKGKVSGRGKPTTEKIDMCD